MCKSVCVVVCVFEPNEQLFENFLESLLCQDYPDLTVNFYFDSTPSTHIYRLVQKNENMSIYVNERQLGSYDNFANAISKNIDLYDYIFLADQDDVWKPNKVRTLVSVFQKNPNVVLAYSDARVITADNFLISDSLNRYEGRNLPRDWQDVIFKNAISGMTMALSSDLFKPALPFPKSEGWHHDTWIALSALILGDIQFVSEVLVDYVQHSGNIVGAKKKKFSTNSFSLVKIYSAWSLKKKLLDCTLAHFNDAHLVLNRRGYLGISHFFCPGSSKFSIFQFKLGQLLGLAYNFLVPIRYYFLKLKKVYNFLLFLFRNRSDANVRVALSNLLKSINYSDESTSRDAKSIFSNESRLKVSLNSKNNRKIILLLPSLEFPVFGGTATALQLGCELIKQGEEVVLVSTDKFVDMNNLSIRSMSLDWNISEGILRALVDTAKFLEVDISQRDIIIPTAWWTCHLAQEIRARSYDTVKIAYLVQDFEPLFYEASGNYARALETYTLADHLIINSQPLANFIEHQNFRIDSKLVFEPLNLFRDRANVVSKNAPAVGPIKVVAYCRPETPRNLFDMLVDSLNLYLAEVNPKFAIEFISVGEPHPDINLNGGFTLVSKGSLDYGKYKELLGSSHIGLSLMLSPHPSYPPLEMADMGLKTVTNDFMGFKKEFLKNVILVEPATPSIASGIETAFLSLANGDNTEIAQKAFMGHALEIVVANLIQKF